MMMIARSTDDAGPESLILFLFDTAKLCELRITEPVLDILEQHLMTDLEITKCMCSFWWSTHSCSCVSLFPCSHTRLGLCVCVCICVRSSRLNNNAQHSELSQMRE